MSELYPKIDETNSFRLQKINEINTYFEKEIEHYREVLRKYKKVESITGVLNITSSIGMAVLGAGTIGLSFICYVITCCGNN